MDQTIYENFRLRRKKTKIITDASEAVVAIPPIAGVEPVQVELALRPVTPQVQDVRVTAGVEKRTGYHPRHRSSNDLGAESYLGSRANR